MPTMLGINIEGKRTRNLFHFRTDPNLLLNRGLINYIKRCRVNTYRLTSEIQPCHPVYGRIRLQVDVQYRFNDHWNSTVQLFSLSTISRCQATIRRYTEETDAFKPTRRTGLSRVSSSTIVYIWKARWARPM
ncbi:MAG: hypothetical protein IPI42_06755 [Saprospiraceae bacterium]|nr:hypothetical protein [Candidatus Parvibacillus calidus]